MAGPESLIQGALRTELEAAGWQCWRLNLFRAGERIKINSRTIEAFKLLARKLPGLRALIGDMTPPISEFIGQQMQPGTFVQHLPLPEREEGLPDLL